MILVFVYYYLDILVAMSPFRCIGVITDDLPQGYIRPGVRTVEDGYLIALVEHDIASLGCDLPVALRKRPRQFAHLLEASMGVQTDCDIALRNF